MTGSLQIIDWSSLSAAECTAALRRPAQKDAATLFESVRGIVNTVRERGDAALFDYTQRFDGAQLSALEVSAAEYAAAERT